METTELTELLKAMDAIRPHVNQTMNYYAPIGQQIAHVDRIDAHFDRNMGISVEGVEADCPDSDIPECLQTEKAQAMWSAARSHGWVDERLQPEISMKKAAIMASVMADELGLEPRWKPFEQLWHTEGLATVLSKAQCTKYYSDALKEFEEALT